MTYKVIFRPSAVKDLRKLNPLLAKRILKKIKFYGEQNNPLEFATKLQNPKKDGTYRFRVGVYRVVFDITKSTIFVLYVEHRKDIYR